MTITGVLEEAWKHTIAIKGNFARAHAHLVALCASEGYLTNREAAGVYTREWLITAAGVEHLIRMKDARNV